MPNPQDAKNDAAFDLPGEIRWHPEEVAKPELLADLLDRALRGQHVRFVEAGERLDRVETFSGSVAAEVQQLVRDYVSLEPSDSGRNIIVPRNPLARSLAIKLLAGHTADALAVLDATGSVLANIAADGDFAAVDGTFAGNVAATGNVSGDQGIFTGNVSGDGGVFTGAGDFAGALEAGNPSNSRRASVPLSSLIQTTGSGTWTNTASDLSYDLAAGSHEFFFPVNGGMIAGSEVRTVAVEYDYTHGGSETTIDIELFKSAAAGGRTSLASDDVKLNATASGSLEVVSAPSETVPEATDRYSMTMRVVVTVGAGATLKITNLHVVLFTVKY